jgi:ribonuclease HII
VTKNNKADLTGQAFNLEKKLISDGYDFVIGVDEAGRGPLAGPVVASACVMRSFQSEALENPKASLWDLIRDSKTLSEKQREKMFDFIHEHFYVGVGICDHKTIDRINILEASFLAMKKAVANLKVSINKCHSRVGGNPVNKTKLHDWIPAFAGMTTGRLIILVDGNKKIPNFSMEQIAIVSGDKIVKSISAASIVAKVTRDRIMREIDKKYPAYQFSKHKGYGTKLHMEMLKKHKPCEIHRRTFAPVARLLKNI